MHARCCSILRSLMKMKPAVMSTVAVALSAALSVGMSWVVIFEASLRGAVRQSNPDGSPRSLRGLAMTDDMLQSENIPVGHEQPEQQRQVGDRDEEQPAPPGLTLLRVGEDARRLQDPQPQHRGQGEVIPGAMPEHA